MTSESQKTSIVDHGGTNGVVIKISNHTSTNEYDNNVNGPDPMQFSSDRTPRKKRQSVDLGRKASIDKLPKTGRRGSLFLNDVVKRDRSGSIPMYMPARRRSTTRGSDGSVGIITQLTRRKDAFGNTTIEEVDKDERRARLRQLARSRKRELFRRFRLVAKLVVHCHRLVVDHKLRNKDGDDEIAPFIKDIHFHDDDSLKEKKSLLFDPSIFKANKQLRISEETKRILQKPSDERTEKELNYAQIALRNIKSFSEYPVRMQRKIAEAGTYAKYGPKRVIVRQGHPATNYYFILSGSVIVMVKKIDSEYAKAAAYLERGQAFGELAIINRQTRQSTVIAKETLELLAINIEDFHRIFMLGGLKNINDPDHEQFMKNINFLRGWPLQVLESPSNQKKCIFNYFKCGDILVKDSNYSDWIFIVKSGSIRVLKKLVRVEPFGTKGHGITFKTEKERQQDGALRELDRRHVLSDLHIPLKCPDDKTTSGPGTPDFKHVEDANRTAYTLDVSTTVSSPLPFIKKQSPRDEFPTKTKKQKMLNSNETNSSSMYNINGKAQRNKQSKGRFRKEAILSRNNSKVHTDIEEDFPDFRQEIRKITDDLDAAFKRKGEDEVTEADLRPQFVTVQTLTKGQAFGINEVILGQQPSFCVISNGAECIMLAKQLYQEHAPEGLMLDMRAELSAYPTDTEMQASLQDVVDWDAYRLSILGDTLKYIHLSKPTRAKRF